MLVILFLHFLFDTSHRDLALKTELKFTFDYKRDLGI